MCLSPEISLDVDADRDGVVEKNNPKKVPRYKGRLNGGLPGPEPQAGSCRQPWSSQQASTTVILQMRRQVPRHTLQWQSPPRSKLLRGTAMEQVPESQWLPSTGWGRPVHRVGGKDECPATEEVLPKHLLLLFCLFFFLDHGEQKIALIVPNSRHIIFNGACTTPLPFLVFHLFVH